MPGDRFACQCVLCHDYGDLENADGMDVAISENVRRFGWHVVMVPEDNIGPGFVCTIRVAHSFGAPEPAMFGLDASVMTGR